MISNDKLLEIKKRCDKATIGPWLSYVEGRDITCGSSFIKTAADTDIELIGATIDDQDFIAHAREDVMLLLEEINNLKGK